MVVTTLGEAIVAGVRKSKLKNRRKVNSANYIGKRRQLLIAVLGGKCSCQDVDCYHDGECGVSDPRCLQLDHTNGDGALDRAHRGGGSATLHYYYNHLSEAIEKLQVLCANCNWTKRSRNGEVRK